ncbi:MAG: hypothetical protein AABX11_06320 [Nanoarchaeota archaeon]
MPSDNPISDITEGLIKASVNLSIEKIESIIKGFKHKDIAFIKDNETINIVKEQQKAIEMKLYKQYIKDKSLLLLIKMGLTLRRLENHREKLEDLRDKIFRKFSVNGLHICELVQTGILSRYISILIERVISIEDLEREINIVLNNIERHTLFVTITSTSRTTLKLAFQSISLNNPSIFIISGSGTASKIIREIATQLRNILPHYELEKISTTNKEILFFKRKIA